MVGSAIKRHLELLGYRNLVYKTSKELDLRNQQRVNEFFES
jgi:GDP-L-fucose synthase